MDRPSLGDIDQDGDLDLLLGSVSETGFRLWLNGTDATSGAYALASLPFTNMPVANTKATFVDVDADGDLDILTSSRTYGTNYERNGTVGTAGSFARQTGANNPLNGHADGAMSFADLDLDGDVDSISVSYLNNALIVSENVSPRGITMSLRVTAQNDLPSATGLPARLSVTEDLGSALDLSAVTLADPDTTAPLTVTLSVSAGRLETPGGTGVLVTGGGTGVLTLTGTMAAIDLLLNTAGVLTYTSAPNDTAPVTLTFAADDGTGPTSLGQFMLDITAVNDLPQGILPQSVFATEDLISGLTLSGLSLSDPDAAAGLSLTLSVAAGQLQALGGAGVTVAGSGSAVLTLTGGEAALNAWLLQPGAVSYLGLAEANGHVAMTVTADDGTGALILGQVDIVVAPVDDAPVILGLPAFVSATEDRAAALDLSALTVSDLDSAGPIRVVVSASAGSLVGLDGAGVVVTGSGSAALTLIGTAADIDVWLNAPGAVT